MIPQIILIALGMVVLGITISRHGNERLIKYNAWTRLLRLIFLYTLLYFGGFWDKIF